MVLVTKLAVVLKERCHEQPGIPSGFRGKKPCRRFKRNRNRKPNALNSPTASAYFFQVICSPGSMRQMRQTPLSTGCSTRERKVFSPTITLYMYRPRGMASPTRMTMYRAY